jgi:hypothetical protein
MLSLRWFVAFFTGFAVYSSMQCRLLNSPFERIARTFSVDGALVVRKWEEQFIPEILDSLKQTDESDR